MTHRQCWSMMQTPQSPSVVGSIARLDVWKCNILGGRCGPPSLTQIRRSRDRNGPFSVSSFDRFAHQPGDPNRPTTLPSVVVQTPLFLPLPLTSRTCRCGRFRGSGTGAAQVCREAGGRVGVDRFVRDLDLGAFNQLDARRIEVIVVGLWRGRGGPAWLFWQPKSEVVGPKRPLISSTAKAKAEEHPRILQGRVRDACVRRWSALLGRRRFHTSTGNIHCSACDFFG